MMIIWDTMNRAAPGAEENSSSDMGKIIAGATTLQEATGGLVLLVHHSGKESGRGMRGHSSLHAAQDAVLEVKRNEGGAHTLTLVKSKDGEDGTSHGFDLMTVELGNDEAGKLTTSCAVEEVEGVFTAKKQSEPRGVNKQIILSAAKEILVQQRMLCAIDTQDPPDGLHDGIPFNDVLAQVWDSLDNVDQKHRKLRAKEALTSLIEQGYLIMTGDMLALPNA